MLEAFTKLIFGQSPPKLQEVADNSRFVEEDDDPGDFRGG